MQVRKRGSYELDHKESLRDQLVNKIVIEYPVINVVLPEDAGQFIIIPPVTKSLPNLVDDEQAHGPTAPTLHEAEGVPLREEEIDETGSERVPFREEEIEEGEFVP